MLKEITKILENDAENLFQHKCIVPNKSLYLPNPNFIDEVLSQSDRPISVLRNLQTIYNHGRLANTGYLSILPVDQGVEHSAGASFAPNPIYFDPENIVRLAINGECNAVVSTLGVLGSVARKYAHKIPFIVKLNHNELLTYPESYDQILFADVDQTFNMGAVGIGATIFFGSKNSNRQIQEISKVFKYAHQMGLVTVLWAYLRNATFKTEDTDYHLSADLTGQANQLGVTIEADIIKQKQPTNNGGYIAVNFEEQTIKFILN